MMEIFFSSLLLGSIAGLSAGLFGIGGGVLVVPLLSWLFQSQHFPTHLVMVMAIATSLATALFTSTASVRTHYRLGNIIWPRALRLSPSLLLGAFCGAVIAKYIAAEMLRSFFVVYLAYTGLKMALPTRTSKNAKLKSPYLDYPVGLCIGCISALLGIGGGTMTVPFLASSGLAMKNAVATSSTCALPIAFSAVVSYVFLGWYNHELPQASLGYIYLPAFFGVVTTGMLTAPLGAKLAHRLPALHLKRYFSMVLLLMALKMAW